MAIIRVSSRSSGKINRLYGSRNLLISKPSLVKYSEKDKERFYKILIQSGKNPSLGTNYKSYAKKINKRNKGSYTISNSSIKKVLKAYQKTIQMETDNRVKKRLIQVLLLKNLRLEKVHHSVVKNIIEYESIKLSEEPIKQRTSISSKVTKEPAQKSSIKTKDKTKSISRTVISVQENSKFDAYKTIHNYLIIDPNRNISTSMEEFWTKKISTINRLYNLQLFYQFMTRNPHESFEAAIKNQRFCLNKEEKIYLKKLWIQ